MRWVECAQRGGSGHYVFGVRDRKNWHYWLPPVAHCNPRELDRCAKFREAHDINV